MTDSMQNEPSTGSNFKTNRQPLARVRSKLKTKSSLEDRNNWTPLHFAAYLGNDKMARVLLQNGADVNAINENGVTPIYLACHRNHDRCIKTILGYKPRLNAEDTNLNSPLNLVLKWFTLGDNLLRMFLDGGADPNAAGIDGFRPLHYVALGRKEPMKKAVNFARILIDYGADVKLINRLGDTPLHIAVREGSEALVPIFLENDADINIKNSYGHSAMDIALGSNRTWMQNILDHLGKHLIIKHCYALQVNEKYLEKILDIERLENFKEDCDLELAELKNNNIGNSSVTYYDMLVSPTEKVANYVKNIDILKTMMNFDIWKYNIFGEMLVHNFHNGLKRRSSRKIGYKFFFLVFPVILPDICIDKIIEYLNNEDLNNLEEIIPS